MRLPLAAALLTLSLAGHAQDLFDPATLDRIAASEARGHLRSESAPPGRGYDVRYLRLEWAIDPAVRAIGGRVTTWFTATTPLASLRFDLDDTLIVDGVFHNGEPVVFAHGTGDTLHVELPMPLAEGALDSVTVQYHGTPPETGFGSFVQDQHSGVPVLWTLSEPYGAQDWWPCKQDLNDKADSIDIFVTTPQGFRAAGNGVLVSETPDGPNVTYHWRHRYPIAHYLVATAVTNYSVYTDLCTLPSGVMPVVNYAYPEHLAEAQAATANVVGQIQLYSQLFGNYPFAAEKYGHAEFGWGGGMEHQTMSFVGTYNYEVLAHELGHQWFGDKVTCGSWADIWLNEGFATYLSALVYEHLEPQYWYPFKRGRHDYVVSQPGGSLRCSDTTTVDRLFDGRLTYAKGAMVLNMLRWVCGDSAFFAGVNAYLNDPELAYASALTPQLQAHLEAASGLDLTQFFQDWYINEGFPVYTLQWSQDENGHVTAQLGEATSHPSVEFFALPVPVRFKNATQDSTVVLHNLVNMQSFSFDLPFQADSALVDPELWLLSGQNIVTHVAAAPALVTELLLYPNPATDRLTVQLPAGPPADMEVLDAIGRRVLTRQALIGVTDLDVHTLAPGTYLLEVRMSGRTQRTRFVKR